MGAMDAMPWDHYISKESENRKPFGFGGSAACGRIPGYGF
jgi:hypothetical protein